MTIDRKTAYDLKRLDYADCGGINALAKRITTIDNPILIIGLGGTGINALLRTKKFIADRMQLEPNKDKPANVDYLGIDTDENAISSNYMGMSLSEDEKYLYKMRNFADIVENRTTVMCDDIKKWFSNEVDVSLVRDGAGAYRQVGRFILFQNIDTISAALEGKFIRILANTTKDIFVFVFAGVSGGTGSGTFIDMGYILQSVANNRNARIRTFLLAVLPDVNLTTVASNSAAATNIKRNGFAALKELDYLNNLAIHGKKLTIQYSGSVSVTDTQKPPYEITMLFSGRDANGLEVDYETVMAACSETIVNFIAKETNADFTINSFLSNIKNLTDSYESNLGTEKIACSYKYVTVGVSSARLPMDELIGYLTHLAFEKMSEAWSRPVGMSDIVRVVKSFDAEFENMYNSVHSAVKTKLPNFENYNIKDFANNNESVISECNAAFMRQKQEVDEVISTVIAKVKACINDKNNRLNKDYFANREYGPVVVQRMIFSDDSDMPTITKYCLEMCSKCKINVTDEAVISQLYHRVLEAAWISNRSISDIFTSKKLVREHINNIETLYAKKLENFIFERMSRAYSIICELFMEINNSVYNKIRLVIEELRRLFEAYGDVDFRRGEQLNEEAHRLSWNMIDVPDFICTAQNMMTNNPNLAVEFDTVIGGFYENILNDFYKWANNNVADNLNQCMSDLFGNIINESMESYITVFAAQNNRNVNDCYEEINSHLTDAVLFNRGTRINPDIGFSWTFVPENCVSMLNYFRDSATGPDYVFGTALNNNVTRLRFEAGVPIMDYFYLERCECAYEECIRDPGLHLYEPTPEGGKVDWRDIPAPNPSTKWTREHRDEMEKSSASELSKVNKYFGIFDKAKEYGYIYLSAEDNKYHALRDKAPTASLDEILKANGIDSVESNCISAVQARSALKALRSALHIATKNGKALFDLDYFENINLNREKSLVTDGVQNEEYTKEYFYKNMTLRGEIKLQVEAYEDYLDLADKLLAFSVNDIIINL